jgi:hypothetical protein
VNGDRRVRVGLVPRLELVDRFVDLRPVLLEDALGDRLGKSTNRAERLGEIPLVDAKVRDIERKLPTALLLNRRGRPYTESGFNS